MRNSHQRAILAATAILLLSNAAAAAFESREEKLRAIKNIGIVSALGDQFTFVRGGLTGLDNSIRSVPIGRWGLDDLIVQQATVVLNGRFQVMPVSYPRTTFAAVNESPIKPLEFVRGDPFKKLVQTEVTPQGLDAYVVITKTRMNFGAGSRKVEGVGLVTYKTVLETYSQIHALYEIRVVDGKTFDVIAKMVAQPTDNLTNVKMAGPSQPFDGGFSSSTSDTQDENLHRAVVDLIVRSLPSTLRDMHLR
jgi:hypothetical protein